MCLKTPDKLSTSNIMEDPADTFAGKAQAVTNSLNSLSGSNSDGPPNTRCACQSSRLVLHAVNAVYLKSLNKWIRMDARGNTNGIDAQFSLELEQLAFKIHPKLDEEDGLVIYSKPPACVAHALSFSKTAQQLKDNLPSYILDKDSILFVSNRPEVVMEKGKGMSCGIPSERNTWIS